MTFKETIVELARDWREASVALASDVVEMSCEFPSITRDFVSETSDDLKIAFIEFSKKIRRSPT